MSLTYFGVALAVAAVATRSVIDAAAGDVEQSLLSHEQ
jgi:hypothetical protein